MRDYYVRGTISIRGHAAATILRTGICVSPDRHVISIPFEDFEARIHPQNLHLILDEIDELGELPAIIPAGVSSIPFIAKVYGGPQRAATDEEVSSVSAAQTALALNHDVYKALSGIDLSKADSATRYYIRHQLLEFRLAGVDKDEATRKELKRLNEKLTDLQSMFDRNIADDQKTVELVDAADLDGLPPDYIDSHKPGSDGKIHISTRYPDLFPVLTFAKSSDLRRRLWSAFQTRAYPKNREVLTEMMQTCFQIANLIGYPSWAEYNAADKMIGRAGSIAQFIDQLNVAARPAEEKEFVMMLAEKRKREPKASEIATFENLRYLELVRRSQYDFDSQSVRPCFPYARVKRDIMDTASRFFHVSFRQEANVPAWDPSVETWDISEGDR